MVTMMCGYFLTDVMSPLENLLTTKGQVVYFTDDTLFHVFDFQFTDGKPVIWNWHANARISHRKLSMSSVTIVESIFNKTPDLVISDVMMPEMDGLTLCRKIKQNVNLNHIPVILHTERTTGEDAGCEIGVG